MIDSFNGRSLLVYIDPLSAVPSAIETNVSSCQWQDGVLVLNDGVVLRDGRFYDENNIEQKVVLPNQMFTCWYGFSYTCPDCSIYSVDH